MSVEQLDRLRRGLSDLRTGALLNLIVYVVVLLSLLPLLPMTLESYDFSHQSESVMYLLAISVSGILAAILIGIVAFYKFFRATGHFKDFNAPRLGIGRIGVTLQLVGLLIFIFGMVIVIAASLNVILEALKAGEVYEYFDLPSIFESIGVFLLAAIVVFLLTAIILLIGALLFGAMVMRLSEVEGLEKGFRTAGILYIVGILLAWIPYISLIAVALDVLALILIYIYSSRGLTSLTRIEGVA
ncbi:MAG: DUF973 family protein [Candidatus Korarchaeum sp.]|nr:DUF973 family protein [Candidatus Korarchaeum sp.]